VRQDLYIQHSLQFRRDSVRVQAGLRWGKLDTEREQPISGQFSVSFRAASSTTLEAGWGHFAQLPDRGGISGITGLGSAPIGIASLPYQSTQYVAAIEQRLGERTRVRIEVFDRQNESRLDLFSFQSQPALITLIVHHATIGRDYSRGLQFLLQRRSENRLSGWIGYTFLQAQFRYYTIALPPPLPVFDHGFPYTPTQQDQPNTVNVFGTYRLTPSIRVSAKILYGSGFPYTFGSPVRRIGPYERIDLRGEKSWSFKRWKLGLYTELLNATNHDNHRFSGPGFPIVPTAGLGFDF